MIKLFSTLIKITIASMVVGAVLHKLDISAEQVLLELGLTPDRVMQALEQGMRWALPNVAKILRNVTSPLNPINMHPIC